MEFGVIVPSLYSADTILAAAKTTEDNGLEYFFLTDHYMTPMGNSSVDAWIALSAVAAITKNVRIGTCVTPIPFRPPAQLAKIVSTVDQISNGRAMLGVGSGWGKDEYMAYSSWDDDGKVRARKTREGLDLILTLWDKKRTHVDFSGKYYSAKGAILEPKPIQNPHIPLWFGTEGTYMLKVAARMAEGWLAAPGVKIERYRQVIFTIREEEKRIGRKDHVKIACNGSVSEFRSNLLEQYANEGCEIALLTRATSEKDLLNEIRKLGKEIVPSYR